MNEDRQNSVKQHPRFRKILSFSYDSPGIVWDDDWRGLVFSLLVGGDGRYKVAVRLPLKGYDEECVYCVGNVNVERMSEVIGEIDGDGDECCDWLLPLHAEKRIQSILSSLKLPAVAGVRDADDYNPIYLFTLFDPTVKRQYRFNRNNAVGFEPLLEIFDLMRCGRGGVIGQLFDMRGGKHNDGDLLFADALEKISESVERYRKGELSKDDVCEEYCFWDEEIEMAVNGGCMDMKRLEEFRDEVFYMTIDDDIFEMEDKEEPK